MDPSKKYELGSLVDLDIQENDINHSKMQESLRKTHARKRDGKPYTSLEVCCNVSSGCHFCFTSSKECEIERFGVGVTLYFRYLKYLILFFVFYAIMMIPSIYFSTKVTQEFQNRSYDYKSLLFYTTLGILGKGRASCGIANLNSDSVIQFTCQNTDAVISNLSTLEWGVSLATSQESLTCDEYSVFSWDPTSCKNADTTAISNAYSQCEGQQSCQFQVSSDFWDQSACPGVLSDQFYFNAYCTGGTVQLPGGRKILLSTAGFIIACCDAIISVFFLWMIFTLSISEKTAIKMVRKKSLSIGTYTIEVMNLPKNMTQDELRGPLWDHFQKAINAQSHLAIDVVDVQFAQSQTLLVKETELGDLIKKRKILVKRFVKKFDPENHNEIIDTNSIIPAAQKNKKALPLYKKIDRLNKRINAAREKIEIEKSNPKKKIVSAFVTFQYISGRNKALTQLGSTSFDRACFNCCCCFYSKSPQIFKGNFLEIEEAPDAQNVLWENLDISTFSKLLRRLISIVITIVLWIITFIVIIVIKNEQDKLGSDVRPTEDCTGFSASLDQIASDYALGSASKGYLECYCRDDPFSKVNVVFNVNGSPEKLCQTWITDKSLVIGLPFIISFGIVIINMLLKSVYETLSKFEGHRNLTQALSSKTIKVFVSQFLNTGLIILVINGRFSSSSPDSVLTGQFDDMNPSWYYSVGATILLTMLINVFSFPITVLITAGIKKLMQWRDRGYSSDPKKTKKKSQKAYVNLYTGPEFGLDFRYAQILTLLFVCLVYGSGLPLLYFFTLVQLILLYWIDKCFFLRVNKRPIGYDEFLAKTVRAVMYYIIVVHLAFSVWNYGNNKIFENSDVIISFLKYNSFTNYINSGTETTGTNNQYYIQQWIRERIFRDQTIILTVLLFLFAVILLIKFFVQNVLRSCFKICCTTCHSSKTVEGSIETLNYYSVLTREEIDAEIPFVSEAINESEDPGLKNYLNKRLANMQNANQMILTNGELDPAKRLNTEQPILAINENEDSNPSRKFLGIFSYEIRHNPRFQQRFGIDARSRPRSSRGPRSPKRTNAKAK